MSFCSVVKFAFSGSFVTFSANSVIGYFEYFPKKNYLIVKMTTPSHNCVLSIQSTVVSGYVGNKCASFALQVVLW